MTVETRSSVNGRRNKGVLALGIAIGVLILCLFLLPMLAKKLGWLKPTVDRPLNRLRR